MNFMDSRRFIWNGFHISCPAISGRKRRTLLNRWSLYLEADSQDRWRDLITRNVSWFFFS
jgi:hypothetical protein